MTSLAVVMPVRDEERHVAGALRAVLGQSRPPDAVYVVDDGSTDATPGVLRAADPRVHVVTRGEPSGNPVVAVAAVLDRVHAGYVYFASANDLVLPGAFAALLAMADRQPGAALLVGCTGLLRGPGDVQAVDTPWRRTPGYLSPAEVRAALDHAFIRGPATVWRTDLARALWPDLAPLLWLGDTWPLHVLALRHGLCASPATVCAVRAHAGSVGGRIGNAEDRRAVGDAWVRLLNDPRYADVRDALLGARVMGIGPVARPVAEYVRWRAARELIPA